MSDIAPFTANGKAVSESDFQALALNTGQHVVIEACAGSGKTWLLVARILKLLLQGVPPTQILAITFTRKAAQEMKARLADMLDELHDSPQSSGAALLAAMNQPLNEATVAAIAAAWNGCRALGEWPNIMTFHEWFGELRQNAPLSVLANAGARLSDDEAALQTQAWQQFWSDTREQPELHSAMQAGVLQLGLARFEAALNAVLARRAEWLVYTQALQMASAKPPEGLNGEHGNAAELAHQAFAALAHMADVPQLWDAVRALAPRLNTIAKHYLSSQTATPLKRGHALQAAFAALKGYAPATERQLHSAIALLMSPLSLATGAVVNTKVYKDMQPNLARFAGGVAGFEGEIEALHAALHSLHHQASVRAMLPAHQAVLRCASHLITAYQSNKQASGLIDFTDLEIDALALLSLPRTESAPVRHVLLDEFQDTNPVQWQSLQAFVMPLLAEAAAGGQAASLFVVGDPKQSIYRFRRADPQLFSHVQRSLQARFGAVLLKTQRTRRNAQSVNAWVNAVFAPQDAPQVVPQGALQTEPPQTHAAGLFSTQFTHSPAPGQLGVLTLLSEQAQAAGQTEAHQVVGTLLAWKRRNPELNWSQAMVLARKRQALAPIAAALHAQGVASVSADRGGFFALPEIADAMSLLSALANPADALTLLNALRSPLFAIDDAQLSELLLHSATASQAPWLGIKRLNRPWAQGVCAWLESWQALCGAVPVHDALDTMMHQAQWGERFAANEPERARAIAANLAQLLRLALSVHQGRYPSLDGFIQAAKALRESDAVAAQSAASLDAVRLSTIHGAKGLEADCVVMVDLYSRDVLDETVKVLLDWPTEQSQPSLFAVQLCPAPVLASIAPLAAVLQAQEQARLTEQDTLLYVAMTRAVNELWISATAKKNNHTVYERLVSALAIAGLSAADGEQLDAAAARPVTAMQTHAQREALAALATLAAPAPAPVAVPVIASSDDYRLGDALNATASPQALGTLMHSVLEYALRYQSWPSDATLSKLSHALGLPVDLAQALLIRSQAMAQALALFALADYADYLAIEQTLFHQGQPLRPDLVAYHYAEKTAWVIDYKLSFDPGSELAANYAQQLNTYARAISAAGYQRVQAYILTLSGQCWSRQAGQWVLCAAPWQSGSLVHLA